jgi:hypothetical protein
MQLETHAAPAAISNLPAAEAWGPGLKPATAPRPPTGERHERLPAHRGDAAQYPAARSRLTGHPPSMAPEEAPRPQAPTAVASELSAPPVQKITQRPLKLQPAQNLPPLAAEIPEASRKRAPIGGEPEPAVHIGSLEVRIVMPPQPLVQAPQKPVPAPPAAAHSEIALARGFGSFGLTQS